MVVGQNIQRGWFFLLNSQTTQCQVSLKSFFNLIVVPTKTKMPTEKRVTNPCKRFWWRWTYGFFARTMAAKKYRPSKAEPVALKGKKSCNGCQWWNYRLFQWNQIYEVRRSFFSSLALPIWHIWCTYPTCTNEAWVQQDSIKSTSPTSYLCRKYFPKYLESGCEHWSATFLTAQMKCSK